jgi:hypothetical protein
MCLNIHSPDLIRMMFIPAVEEVIIYYLNIGSIHPAEKRRMTNHAPGERSSSGEEA